MNLEINSQVLSLLEELSFAGETNNPRGLVTKEAHLAQLDIDPLHPIMDFIPRRFNYKYFAGELAWYINADTSLEMINHFSSFWKGICPTGHANSNYGSLMFNTHPDTEDMELISGAGVNQLEWVYGSLCKDRHTRQAVAFFNSPYFQYEGNKDFVCTMYVNFWIRKEYLDMKVQMRSNDVFFGLTYDAPWFSTLHQSMYLNLLKKYPDLKLGKYYHCADNIHYYDRHFDLVEKILDAEQLPSTKLKLKAPLFEFKEEDVNYEMGSDSLDVSPQTIAINPTLVLTKESAKYLVDIKEIVNSGNIPTSQEFWKEKLRDLYDIN